MSIRFQKYFGSDRYLKYRIQGNVGHCLFFVRLLVLVLKWTATLSLQTGIEQPGFGLQRLDSFGPIR